MYTTKVGLITADEVSMAGGVYEITNNYYYLYTGQIFLTITPFAFLNGYYSEVFRVYESGQLNNADVDVIRSVRPVINLSADVTLTGTGTASDPYIVV